MKRVGAALPALLAAVVMALPQAAGAQIQGSGIAPAALPAALPGNKIPQFVQPLPVLGTGIPVVSGSAVSLSTCEYEQTILPPGTPLAVGATGRTWVWGYQVDGCGKSPGSYIGPVIVATRGTPTQVTYQNSLTDAVKTKVIAYQQGTDQTLYWADPLNKMTEPNPVSGKLGSSELNFCNDWVKKNPGVAPPPDCGKHYSGQIATAPHLHGGEIPAMLDGGPDAWWTADGIRGHGFYSNPNVQASASQAVYTYPNGQEPAPIWFHDHTLGATRLNVYAGIAGAYMVIDPNTPLPAGMTVLGLANGARGAQEPLVPIVIQDRMFDVNGQLLFPNVGINPDHPFWIPEFVGDTIVVNGKAWPFHTVEPKRYRFLFLNGSNARTYELFLINKATSVKGPVMNVIGDDQGYLDKPAKLDPNGPKPNDVLVMMPGERYEVIIDFSAFAPGTSLLLANSGKTPYPAGAPPAGRTLGRIMEFRVGSCTSGQCGAADGSYNPALGTPIRTSNPIVRLANPLTGTPALQTTASGAPGTQPVAVHKVRRLTLNEVIAAGGPVEILVNNTPYTGAERVKNGFKDFTEVTTEWNTTYYSEVPHEGETELWEIVNLTADAHPIHPHLVGFQILNRQAFDVKGYNAAYAGAFPGMVYIPGYGPPSDYNCNAALPLPRGVISPDPAQGGCTLGGNPDVTPFLVGAAVPPRPSESGWKDTVLVPPGQVTRFLVRFAPTSLPNATPADEAFYDFAPDSGHGFVWHCHIIDHEDNEMMRPMGVLANPGPAVARKYTMGVDY